MVFGRTRLSYTGSFKDRYGSFDQDPAARVKRREMLTGGLGFRQGHALEVDGDEVFEAPGDDGGEDEERRDGARSNPWSILPISSWRDAEGWLEAATASDDDELLAPLQNRMIPVNKKMRQRVGR
jgi:hypothetical protein